MQQGRDVDAYLDKIIVRGGYFSLYFTRVPVGTTTEGPRMAWSHTGLIYNLDQPNRPPLSANRVDSVYENNISHWVWIYNNHSVRRFRFEAGDGGQQIFEEINLDDADYQPL